MSVARVSLALGALIMMAACHRSRASTEASASGRRRFDRVDFMGSEAPSLARPCAACHAAQFARWRASQHANAQRIIAPSDRAAMRSAGPEGSRAMGVIGVAPVQQWLVEVAGGRWQVLDPAWDPARREAFSVFGADARAPGDWGHWTGRGMNWNSQCAFCHVTGFAKGYQPGPDAYRSTWDAVGVACAQCHGSMDGHGTDPTRAREPARAALARAMDNCAACHARRDELTGRFAAGERFDDHYRLTLADTPGAYHPDGRAADEDFEYGSFSLSAMGHRGVTCLDCHEPHGGGLRAPVTRDELCNGCHASGARGAPRMTTDHAHHPAASDGARCVNCHMPRVTFMARDARRDHGFTSPDPALTREFGVHNACDGCHRDAPGGWAEARVRAWFGGGTERPARSRARTVARALRGDAEARAGLLDALAREANPAWRASLTGLLIPWAHDPEVEQVLRTALTSRHAIERASAVRALSADGPPQGPLRDALSALRGDPSRLVRIDAAWALRDGLDEHPASRADVLRWVEWTSDQPPGAMRRSELALQAGRADEARTWAQRAAAWDRSARTLSAWGAVLAATGAPLQAAARFEEAAEMEPADPRHPFARALALASAGRLEAALAALERTVALNPAFPRARYNLALALAGLGRIEPAIEALRVAETLVPQSADEPFARATLHVRLGQRSLARSAALRVLAIDPTHPGARALLQELPAPR